MISIEFLKNETTKTIYNVYQWNYGRTLNIKGLDLNNDIDVQFSIDRYSSALVEHKIENDVLIVPIPNQFLTNRGVIEDFKVYAYISIVDENSYRTVKNIVINVTGCPKPDDYVYTETEIVSYESIVKRVTELEKGNFVEKDPTVPMWAKQENKPTYTAKEIGAQPEGDYALKDDLLVSASDTYTLTGNEEIILADEESGTAYLRIADTTFEELSGGLTMDLKLEADGEEGNLHYDLPADSWDVNESETISTISTLTIYLGVVHQDITYPSGVIVPKGTYILIRSDWYKSPWSLTLHNGKWITPVTTVDEALNADSTNPIQNKAVAEKLDKLSLQIASLSLGIHTDGLIYVFVDGKPVGSGLSISGEVTEPEATDDITLTDGVMTILALANEPTLTDGILYIS